MAALTDRRTKPPSLVLLELQILAALWAVGAGPLALLLGVVADTWSGRLFAVTALLSGVLPWLLIKAARNGLSSWRRISRALVVVWAVGLVTIFCRAPTGAVRMGSRVQQVYAGGQSHFSRYALGNLLPEGDQLLLGFTLMPLVDPILKASQGAELRRITAPIYRELEQDPDFHALGSVLPEVYANLRGGTPHPGHSFVYVPAERNPGTARPVLVFFHGSGGDFKAYLWLLSKIADRLDVVIVAPSYGMGNWQASETPLILAEALTAAAQVVPIDRQRVHLMGLSNGGLAVSQAVADARTDVRSVILLSPVFDAAEIEHGSGAGAWRDKPVLVASGGFDDRVPMAYVEENVERLSHAGARVQLQTVADADHFLVFSHRDQVTAVLESWLRENR